jgi:hypothetical protein
VVNNAAARLGGLVAFGGTSASDVASVAVVEAYRRVVWTAASVAVVEAYRRVVWTAAALAVAAALMALAWLGNEPPERRRAN